MRKLWAALVTAAALVVSLGSIYFLVDHADSALDLVAFFAAQAVSSALLAAITLTVMPPHWRQPKAAVFALLFSFAFFIPLFGAAGMLLAVLLTLLLPKRWRYKDFEEVSQPQFESTGREAPQLRVSSLRTALLDPNAPAELRLRSLVAMQTMPMRTVGPLLRKLLGDPSEDLRLLAYGMLDSAEKKINALIGSELQNLEKNPERSQRLNSLRHLAELNWELVYTGLVQGDVREHAINSALRYLREALKLAGTDAGLWLLRGRLLQARGDFGNAEEAINLAVSCGLDESRALPYLAELAFAQRSFMLVRDYLGLVGGRNVTPTMMPVVRFWTGRAAEPGQMAA